MLHKEELTRLRNEHPQLAMQFDRMVIHKTSQTLIRSNKLLAALTS